MQPQNIAYRQAALQNLAVAERLDTAVQVVGPATSMVVFGAACLIVTALVWAVIGRVPLRVYGDGLLLREGSIVDVTSMADGQVQELVVSVGDIVKENDILARIDQPELKKQRSLLQAKLDELSQKDARLVSIDKQGNALKHAVFSQQREAVTFVVEESKKQLAFLKEKLTADEALLAKGLVTPGAVAETRQRVLDMTDSIYMKQAEGRNISFSALDAQRVLQERTYDLGMEVSETTRELEELDKRTSSRGAEPSRLSKLPTPVTRSSSPTSTFQRRTGSRRSLACRSSWRRRSSNPRRRATSRAWCSRSRHSPCRRSRYFVRFATRRS
jgi:HlyD family secretion protein